MYQRVRSCDSVFTPVTSPRNSVAYSETSEMTVGDISAVSVRTLGIHTIDLSYAEHCAFGTTTEFEDSSTLLATSRRNFIASCATSEATIRNISEVAICALLIYNSGLSDAEHSNMVQPQTCKTCPSLQHEVRCIPSRKDLLLDQQKRVASREFNTALSTAQKKIVQKRALKAKLEQEQAKIHWETEIRSIIHEWAVNVILVATLDSADAATTNSIVNSTSQQTPQSSTTPTAGASLTQTHPQQPPGRVSDIPQRTSTTRPQKSPAAVIMGISVGAAFVMASPLGGIVGGTIGTVALYAYGNRK